VRNAVVVAILCMWLLSCVSTATTMLNPASKRPPITPDRVVIYTSKDNVPGKYEEVALLTSQGDYIVAGDDKFYQSFRQEAAKIGANGVIIAPIEDPTTGQKVGSAILGAFLIPTTMANRKTQATAIYVLPKPPTAEETAAQNAAAAERSARIETLGSVVHPGMTREAMLNMVGPPTKSMVSVDTRDWRAKTRGDSTETATYVSTAGTTFVVTLRNDVVSSVTRHDK